MSLNFDQNLIQQVDSEAVLLTDRAKKLKKTASNRRKLTQENNYMLSQKSSRSTKSKTNIISVGTMNTECD